MSIKEKLQEKKFHPSSTALGAWMYTKKNPYMAGRMELPGLFSSTSELWHILGFILILVLEGIATFLANDQGLDVTIVLILIVIDFILAAAHHWFTGKILRLRNSKFLVSDDKPEEDINREMRAIERKIRKKKKIQLFWVAMIFASAAAKVFFVYNDIFFGQITPSLLGIAGMYFTAAYLHITTTGYFGMDRIFSFKISQEYKKFERQGPDSAYYRNPVHIAFQDNKIPSGIKSREFGHSNRHKLEVNSLDGANGFYISGVLLDDELKELIQRHSQNEQRTWVGHEGLNVQFSEL